VAQGSQLRDVILMGSDFYEGERRLGGKGQPESGAPLMGVGRNCRLERCIVDKNARIGDDVVIASHADDADHQGEHCWIRDGITIIPKGTVVPPGTCL
jgi:glucose-1-phosphate adenylyltransferase